MPVRTEAARERRRQRARERYWADKRHCRVNTAGAYRGPESGEDGQDARCSKCGHVFTDGDFLIDPLGCLLEPELCARCHV